MNNNRCTVCDWNPMGMCANYEIDKYLSKGQANKVVWDPNRGIFICLKCYNAIEKVKYEHVVEDEKEAQALLEDFSDEEISDLKDLDKDIIQDCPIKRSS